MAVTELDDTHKLSPWASSLRIAPLGKVYHDGANPSRSFQAQSERQSSMPQYCNVLNGVRSYTIFFTITPATRCGLVEARPTCLAPSRSIVGAPMCDGRSRRTDRLTMQRLSVPYTGPFRCTQITLLARSLAGRNHLACKVIYQVGIT